MPASPWTSDDALPAPSLVSNSHPEDWSDTKISAQAQLRVPWADRYDVATNILANGLQWPYHAPGSPLRAVRGVISPDGAADTLNGTTGLLEYEEAILSITYESADASDPDEEGNVVVYSESMEPTAEFLTLPYTDLLWGSHVEGTGIELKPEEAPGQLVPGFDYVLTYYNLTSIPAAFLDLIGKCNVAAVPSAFFSADLAAETLMYNPPKINRSVSLGGDGSTNKWTLATRLTYKANGWNKFWRVEASAWQFMYYKGVSTPHRPIPTASFAGILPNGILP